MKIVLGFASIAVCLLAGCAEAPHARAPDEVAMGRAESAADHDADHDDDDDATPLPSTPSRVVVLQGEPERPIEVIGLIDVHSKSADQPMALERLKGRAERVGADAVVDVEFHHGEAGGEPSHLSGTAVRFRDLLQGREYDSLGQIEGKAEMGDEGSALRRLKERARALGASLIIHVKFEHGEGNEETRVQGEAIRFH